MSEWRSVKLGDLGKVVTGSTPPKAHPEWFGEGIPFITPTDMGFDERRVRVSRHLSREGEQGLRSRLLPAGSVCFVSIGATIGKVCLTDSPAVTNQQINSVVPVVEADGRFLYYLLRNESAEIAQIAGGAATPIINKASFSNISFPVPGPRTQAKIGSVLGLFDDLIENNRRRIELLESMARAVYREWFVHFRFPGHEDVPTVDSDLGPIPEGWVVRSLVDVARNHDRYRRPLSKRERTSRQGAYPYYGAAKLIDRIDGWIFDGEYLLFAEDGSVETDDGFPVLQLVEGKFWANNHTHVLEGVGLSTRFLLLACERVPIRGYMTGAAQPKITQANLNRIPILVGLEAVHAAFDRMVDPLFDEVRVLKAQEEYLIAMRDLLLPRLVSGEIDVSGLDLDGVINKDAVIDNSEAVA